MKQLRSLAIDCPSGFTHVDLPCSLSSLRQLTQLRLHCERLTLGEGVQLPPNVEQLSLMDEEGVALPQQVRLYTCVWDTASGGHGQCSGRRLPCGMIESRKRLLDTKRTVPALQVLTGARALRSPRPQLSTLSRLQALVS